jgi:hypothetical protein
MHELDAHDRIIVKEAARVVPVSPDTADDGGEMDSDIGLLFIVHPADVVEAPKIVLGDVGDRNERTFPIFLEFLDEMST